MGVAVVAAGQLPCAVIIGRLTTNFPTQGISLSSQQLNEYYYKILIHLNSNMQNHIYWSHNLTPCDIQGSMKKNSNYAFPDNIVSIESVNFRIKFFSVCNIPDKNFLVCEILSVKFRTIFFPNLCFYFFDNYYVFFLLLE